MKIEDFEKFKKPFPEKDIEWRLQSSGKGSNGIWALCLAYITSRAVQERLDAVCGPDGWKTSIKKDGDAYLCELSIRVTHDDGTIEWLSRVDGADATDIEPVKGGISGALKRVAVQFGIGRYLYNLEENFATILPDDTKKKCYTGKTKDGTKFKWLPPALPDWALPEDEEVLSKLTPEQQNELKREKVKLKDWIQDGVLCGDYLKKANFYLKTNNLQGIKDTNKWCASQVEVS